MKLTFLKNLETPLAWAQLSHQKVRLAVATTGVCFANILMFTQMGLLSMLTEGTTKLHESLAGDLFLVSSFSPTLRWGMSFPRSVMYQAGGIDGVASVSPIYISSANWVNPQELSKTNDSKQQGEAFTSEVRIIAINPAQPPVFNLSEVNQQITKLNVPDTVLFDRFSQDSFGDIPQLINGKQEITTIMGNRRTYIIGLFNMGSSLSNNGNVIMSDWNYAQRSGGEKLDQVAIGVLRLDKGANLKAIQATLRANFLNNLGVEVYTRQELIVREQEFEMSEPNGVVLTFGTIVGFLVGVIIVYQVLYSDINDHLSEYATLKAMGYSDISLLNVIITEAIILGIMGFIPGFIASLGLYQLLASLTKIPLTMKLTVGIQVFILTQIMCALSGAIATNKLRSADPADVF
ncbi:ABC transporter permease DevC [Calothrix rhizosoleniae]|uniref:ABC transporter permease DevC n=1 Tax=Calothrix rhizosoleniae TaxID=888997 RepID=UPI000B49CB30|nr:ABC transporter permease DevC [Calothrix rhizosoleniae]